MVETNAFSEVGGALVGKIFSGVLWFGIAIVVIGVLGFLMWYFFIYKKKFDIQIKITSERSGSDNLEIEDKGAILKEWKEKTPYLRVWGLKRDFCVPKYDVIRKLYKGGKSIDYLEIYRKGENQFYFLLPPKIDNKKIIKEDGKMYLLAEQKQLMMDPDMAFWATKRKSLNKKMIDTESLLAKILPHLPAIIGGMITIFVLYILLSHLPGILAELSRLVGEMTKYQRAEVITSSSAFIPLMIRRLK